MGNQGCKKDSGISGCLDVCGGFEGEPCRLLYGHISEKACRVDYLIVSKKYRNLQGWACGDGVRGHGTQRNDGMSANNVKP